MANIWPILIFGRVNKITCTQGQVTLIIYLSNPFLFLVNVSNHIFNYIFLVNLSDRSYFGERVFNLVKSHL